VIIQQLCVSSYCGLPSQHAENCDGVGHWGGDCRGCLPARAADGLYLCPYCLRRIPHDAFMAALRYEALSLQLVGGGPAGSEGSGAGSGDLELNPAAVEAREAIRTTLVAIVRLVAEERGISLPERPWRWEVERRPYFDFIGPLNRYRREVGVPELVPLAEFIGRHAQWLAAHPAAGEHAKDLRDVGTDPRTWRLAYPSASDRLKLADCPWCGTALYQLPDEPLVTCKGCGTAETWEWWQRTIIGEVGGQLDVGAAVSYLSWRWHQVVTAKHIHNAVLRGRITPVLGPDGQAVRDERGRKLYEIGELVAYFRTVWGPPVDELTRRRRRSA
jgi:hypothetical protein